MNRSLVAWGGVFGALGVILGAFGTHALKARLAPDLLADWQVGVQYQQIHAVALLVVAALSREFPRPALLTARLFAVGIVIFSGSLYALALTGTRWLGAITPLGGLAFIAGWVTLVVAGSRPQYA
jgi:uncharacterized membrane protein YgdD (TMEM256/DUF423 family)